MNVDELRKALGETAAKEGYDAALLEGMALRLALEMPSDVRTEIVQSTAALVMKDWEYVSQCAGRAIQLAADPKRGDERKRPPKVKPKLKSLPKVRELFWCDFPEDAQLPEFWKKRPVVIASYKHTLHGAVTVIPCSAQEQDRNVWSHKLAKSIDGRESWAICDKVTTVAVSRLTSDRTGIQRLDEADFNEAIKLVTKWFPKLLPEEQAAVADGTGTP